MSTYRYCGSSKIGKSHETNGSICQDSHRLFEGHGYLVAAVADGLGSSKHSDIASEMAVNGAVDYCAANIHKEMAEDLITATIRCAFETVNLAIKNEADDCIDDYDTTLTLAVFIDGTVFFGHAGDSGIIALRNDGVFEEVTIPQLGSGHGKERPVYPLAAEPHWVFDKYKHRTRAIFLMTDGVMNKVIPPLLEGQAYKLDHAYLFYLYDNLCKNPNLDNWLSDEVSSILPQEVNYDDKTLVAAVCKPIRIRYQADSYYNFPSNDLWTSLISRHNNDLYSYRTEGSQPTINPTDPNTQGDEPPHEPMHFDHSGSYRNYTSSRRNQYYLLRLILIVLAIGLVLGIITTVALVFALINMGFL